MASMHSSKMRNNTQFGSKKAAPTSTAKLNPSHLSNNLGLGSSRPKIPTPSKGLRVRISSASSLPADSPRAPLSARSDVSYARSDFEVKRAENVVVTVRFRPLSTREIEQGDEVAWYADGDTIVRSEFNPLTSYAYDRVFGPATTTRNVYDVAARCVVSGAMEGINGTVFAYGVTSSGKTHTMHGIQKSPGVIPLAVKDVFNIIQDTPGREYLLRIAYIEIYNEVINDLLNPMGQNLRVREDAQGTYVEGVKQEVVLSPAHALSLIAAGEEHRHVGSHNFNLMSSRSHTIFTLTIESSPQDDAGNDEEITLSQLNLIDLAGSESSKVETTGLQRKEGSYINKSLLTLGTVISKLTEGKSSHVPYRDSKLTRLLQSSLSGNGRVSLICTVTPATSSNEETHNTLKFAQRAKRIEVQVYANTIMDEKSLIKKYQKEIMRLNEELEQLKNGMIPKPSLSRAQEDLITLRKQLAAGQVHLQSRLEEEEQAKEALMARIQRLTKLILVSTKNTMPSNSSEQPSHRRRFSFGEEELAYLPETKRGLAFDEDDTATSSNEGKFVSLTHEDGSKEEKKIKKHGMLAWLKLRKPEKLQISSISSVDNENSPDGSAAEMSSNHSLESNFEFKATKQKFKNSDEFCPSNGPFREATQAGELLSANNRGRRSFPTGTNMVDQIDLLKEQVKTLSGQLALCTSALKRMTEQACNKPDDIEFKAQIHKVKEEIREKEQCIQGLEQRIVEAKEIMAPSHSPVEFSKMISKLKNQLSDRSFELELKSADNRILQEQLQSKTAEIKELQEAVSLLQNQIHTSAESKSLGSQITSPFMGSNHKANSFNESKEDFSDWLTTADVSRELHFVERGLLSKGFDSRIISTKKEPHGNSQLAQSATIEKLKQEKGKLEEENKELKIKTQNMSEESRYAKQLASAAAEELKTLAEEVKKLSSQNSKLLNDLSTAQNISLWNTSNINLKGVPANNRKHLNGDADPFLTNFSEISLLERNNFADDQVMLGTSKSDMETTIQDLRQELLKRKNSEFALEAVLTEKDHQLADIQKQVTGSKRREKELEDDLSGMWVYVARLKKEKGLDTKEPFAKNTNLRSTQGPSDNADIEA